MKIEKVSDNQIRCFLTKSDLKERHLKISELAYGTEKAKKLFRDLMEQASIDLGFENDDVPLMIEAIPTSKDSIVLVITKVDDPEDFEERFSHLSMQNEEDGEQSELEQTLNSLSEENTFSAEELLSSLDHFDDEDEDEDEITEERFVPLSESLQPNKEKKKTGKKKAKITLPSSNAVYSFSSLERIIEAAHAVGNRYQGSNTLWKDEANNRYYLYINKVGKSAEFKKTCESISEYGKAEEIPVAAKEYFDENYKVIIRDKALLTLSIM